MTRRLKVSDEQLLRAIARVCAEDGSATIRRIGAEVGLRSPSAVHTRIKDLEARGLVTTSPHIRLSGEGAGAAATVASQTTFTFTVTFDPTRAQPLSVEMDGLHAAG